MLTDGANETGVGVFDSGGIGGLAGAGSVPGPQAEIIVPRMVAKNK